MEEKDGVRVRWGGCGGLVELALADYSFPFSLIFLSRARRGCACERVRACSRANSLSKAGGGILGDIGSSL